MKSQIHSQFRLFGKLKNLITKKMSKNLKTIAIIVIVILAISCKKNKTVSPNLPQANFTILVDTIPYGIGSNLVFDFTNTSTNATSYRWDFGGGYSATTINARMAYTTADVTNFFTSQTVPAGMLHTNQVKLIAKNGSDSTVVTKTIAIIEEL